MAYHLEFLGYKIERMAPKKEGEKECLKQLTRQRILLSSLRYSQILYCFGLVDVRKEAQHQRWMYL